MKIFGKTYVTAEEKEARKKQVLAYCFIDAKQERVMNSREKALKWLSTNARGEIPIESYDQDVGMLELLLDHHAAEQREMCADKIKMAKRFYLCKPHSRENYVRESESGKLVRLDDVLYYCLNAAGESDENVQI